MRQKPVHPLWISSGALVNQPSSTANVPLVSVSPKGHFQLIPIRGMLQFCFLPPASTSRSHKKMFQKAEAAENQALCSDKTIYGGLGSLMWITVCLQKYQGWHMGKGRISSGNLGLHPDSA